MDGMTIPLLYFIYFYLRLGLGTKWAVKTLGVSSESILMHECIFRTRIKQIIYVMLVFVSNLEYQALDKNVALF